MTREIEIQNVLDALEKAWKKNPNLRLGQLIVIIANDVMKTNDAFYLDDMVLFKELIDAEDGSLFYRFKENK